MADEEYIQNPTDSIKRKRCRHWDVGVTKKLVNKKGEDNIKQHLAVQGLFKFFDDNKKKNVFLLNEKQVK